MSTIAPTGSTMEDLSKGEAAAPPPPEAQTDNKPAVLIIGGLGYIGRFLALHIHSNNLASEVRLVDKVLPELARLPPEFSEACSRSKFMQADASKETSLSKIFTSASGNPFTYVFNCGGETRYSQDPSVYHLRNTQLSVTLATHCAKLSPQPALVEFSTGMIYKPPSNSTISAGGCTETAPLKPWLKIAKAKLAAEEALEGLARHHSLRHATLRIGHVYGPYDVGFLARGLCLARVYQSLGKELKWLWGASLRINTVHVTDVCTAAWKAAEWASDPTHAPSSTTTMADRAFNIVDAGDTSQETLASLFHTVFGIPTGFQASLISQFAKWNLDNVVDDVNEEILQPWADLMRAKGVEGVSPLSPFLEKELLRNCDLCLDGRKAGDLLGWVVGRERLTVEGIREVVGSYERVGWWP